MDQEQQRNNPGKTHKDTGFLNETNFGRYFLLAVFILSLLLFISIIKVFVIEIVLAAVFATLFYPLFRLLLKLSGGKKNLSAFVSCALILILILIPLVFISNIVISQALTLYRTAGSEVREMIQHGTATGVLDRILGSTAGKWLTANNIDLPGIFGNVANSVGAYLAKFLNKTSRATLATIFDLFVILFSIYYFLRDGERILQRLKTVIPLSETHKTRIIERFASISHAIVKGALTIALIQSSLGTLTLLAFGVHAWMLWGVVMFVFSLIPFVGPGAVLIPAGIIRIVSGSFWEGLAIILISVGVVSTIDNFLRPRIVGAHAGMHDLLVFFSTLGGIFAFGPAGLILGPLIAALFITMLDIYSVEFQEHIEYGQGQSQTRRPTSS